MNDPRDTLYSDPLADSREFRFDAAVAQVFPDMIRRSVPGYGTIVSMTGILARRYAQAGSRLYDLGCSLGASTLAMRRSVQTPNCSIVAVDNSAAMIDSCRTAIEKDDSATGVQLACADLADITVENASVVVLNFTLQFVPHKERDAVIKGIADGLRPGGILILSEKVTFEDRQLDELNIALHEQFKLANGYSELEVARKRSALENVLVPETLNAHRERIAAAGFSNCDVWFQCFNFASLVALK